MFTFNGKTGTSQDTQFWILQGGSVVIPADFFGQHFHFVPWTNGWVSQGSAKNQSPLPTYGFAATRSHDWGWNAGAHWAVINTADGVYDWSRLDTFFAYFAGKQIIYTLYGTPQWLASTAVVDLYGYVGGRSPPTDYTKVGTFIAALKARYGSQISYLEVWNEPDSTGFWSGTKANIAQIARQVKLNAGATPVIGPAFVGGPTGQLGDWLDASDGSGGFLKTHLNAVSIHTYFSAPYGPWGAFPSGMPSSYIGQHLTQARTAMTASGLAANFPLINCEQGYDVPELSDAANLAAADTIGLYFKRIALENAARGVRMFQIYAHDDGFGGKPSISPVLSAHIADIASTLPGKTITSLCVLSTGAYRATFLDGSFVTW